MRVKYVDNLMQDAEMDNIEELRTIMEVRMEWSMPVKDVGRPDMRPK